MAETQSKSRLWIIVAVGLALINVAQFVSSMMKERVARDELAEVLSPQATKDRFHQLFYRDPSTLWKNSWFGVLTEQNPNDVWVTQEIMQQEKPDFVVECGAFRGGSALLWATLLKEINPEGRVITIDINDIGDEARRHPLFNERIEFLLGSSVAPELVAKVHEKVGGKKALVILDSDHHKAHVLKELQAYADLVPVGGYLIVQDSNINGHPMTIDDHDFSKEYSGQEGPYEAVEAFVAQDKRFEVDLSKERLMLTMNPHGFLRRVK